MIPERASYIEDLILQDLGLNIRVGPQGFQEFTLRYQATGMLDEVPQYSKRLGSEKDTFLLGCVSTAMKTLIDRVQPEWRKLLHALALPGLWSTGNVEFSNR